jgi:hypothetical protein
MYHIPESETLTTNRPATAERVQADWLVSRYPNLSEPELARLIVLYRSLSPVDLALMSSDENLGPKLEQFIGDHRTHVRTPLAQYATLIMIAVFGFIITAWAVAFRG